MTYTSGGLESCSHRDFLGGKALQLKTVLLLNF